MTIHHAIEMMEIGAIFIFAAYNLVLYKQVKRNWYLYLGLLSFFIFLRATLVDDGSMIFYSFFPGLSFEIGRKIEYFSSYIGAPLSVLFCYSLYPLPKLKRSVNYFLILSALLLAFVLFTPYSIFYHSLIANSILVLVSYVLMYWILVVAIRNHQTGAMFVFAGTLLCSFFVIAELLKVNEILFVHAGPNLVNTGFVIFLFFQSIALSEIFAKSFKENIELNKNLENKVEEKTAEILRASQLRDTLIRIVSHDIRGPLSNLKSVISLVREEQVGLEQAKDFMATIDKGVDHTIRMLDELMEWGHAASQNKRIEQERLNIKEVLDAVVDQMAENIESKNLDFSVSGDLDSACLFDRNGLKVVIRNLVSNAVKFTERGGKVAVNIKKVDEKIVMEICDTGIGIPDEMKANLFEMKKDNKRPGTENEKSSGVGLFICNDLIMKNGGTLEVSDNPEGKGTVFKFVMKSAN